MKTRKCVVAKTSEMEGKYENHGDYEYMERRILSKRGNQCAVAIMEVPPGKASFPYHYHVGITEVFYIIAGKGRLETADGEKEVGTGDVVVFPPGREGSLELFDFRHVTLCGFRYGGGFGCSVLYPYRSGFRFIWFKRWPALVFRFRKRYERSRIKVSAGCR
ncbi:MAG: cupin domain-containing protein, partial [Planctomycetota bacterium]|nr:cupin domain-containing protein [Planctomycetota bacterium]